MSILANVSILSNPFQEYLYQMTLIIKLMSIRANVSILTNPFARIFISSWMSIRESNNFNYKMDEHSSESFIRIYISS